MAPAHGSRWTVTPVLVSALRAPTHLGAGMPVTEDLLSRWTRTPSSWQTASQTSMGNRCSSSLTHTEHRMQVTTLTKAECVRRARNLNQQAVAYRSCGKQGWALSLIQQRKRYMAAARLLA